MAIFQGTLDEFHCYIGPRIRNIINTSTINARKELFGICQKCGQKAELESAHIHGKGMKEIIESVLSAYTINGVVICDLMEVEKKILASHYPLSATFLYLCHKCHIEYDSTIKSTPEEGNLPYRNNENQTNNGTVVDEEFKYLHRIKLWASRPLQINSKIIRAYLLLERNGPVLLSDLKNKCSNKQGNYYIKTFDSNYIQMTTDNGHPHGKVFYTEDEFVKIYPTVREEIRKWFGE